MSAIDFAAYAQRLASQNDVRMMLPVIEKELLHYEIIRAMGERGLLSRLVFQGGTCLRLCYGAPRYSEDLDFVGGSDFTASDLSDLAECIQHALPKKYPVDVVVREPTDDDALVKKWRIKIDTTPQRPDLPAQRISVEVAAVPAYTKQPRALQLNYEGLQAGYEDVILSAESLEEILADKLEAFVCSSHIRYRDVWDMYWIMRRPLVDLEEACMLRKRKEIDYGEEARFGRGLTRVSEQLDTIVNGGEFAAQMKRFLPVDLYEKTVENDEFRTFLLQALREVYGLCLDRRFG